MITPGSATSMLSAQRRRRELDSLRQRRRTEVLVVGGGITGVGIALDAASRGLQTTLVERDDLAHGTSRWSSKLVHGGLRYLAKGAVDVAFESAQERHVLMTSVAPHLIRALPTLIPDFGGTEPLLNEMGLRVGDLLRLSAGTPRGVLPKTRRVDRDTALVMAPGLLQADLRGGIVGWDGQLEDDARLVVAVARTAATYGAEVLTRVAAVEVTGQGARLRDEDGEFDIDADNVITATGVWTSELNPDIALRPSRGTHLVLDADRLGRPTASMTVPVPGSFGRYVFAIPQPDGLVYVGLTDTPADSLRPDPPVADAEEISWLADTVSAALATPIAASDILGTFSGLRPLVANSDSEATADISRRHLVARQADDVVAVTGGKLTTYRRMAQDAVNLISGAPCRTRGISLVGTPGNSRSRDRLVRRYGSEAPLLQDLMQADPRLADPVGTGPELGVEIAWARIAEGALDLDDALQRRTRIGLVPSRLEAARDGAERAWSLAG